MTPAHLTNIALHVAAGTVAMAIGFMVLAGAKGTPRHRRWGRRFGVFTLAVCGFAALGLALFRFLPMFAVLDLLIAYQLASGWHAAHTRGRGPSGWDAVGTGAAAAVAVALLPLLLGETGGGKGGDSVVLATLGALATLLFYDTLRWTFPRRWFARLWRYEHAYKLIASLFGMVSALVGNVVRVGQPWSQLLPSALGLAVIAWWFVRLYRQDGRARGPLPAPG